MTVGRFLEKLFGAWICQDKDFDFSIDCSSIYIGRRIDILKLSGSFVSLYLVDFDCSINFSDEPIAGKESNSSSKKENINRHNKCITEINNCGGETFKRQLRSVIMTGINEEVNRCEAGCQETSPPPSIIFSSQMEIAKKNCSFRTRDDQNQRNQENKSKHVVDLMTPD